MSDWQLQLFAEVVRTSGQPPFRAPSIVPLLHVMNALMIFDDTNGASDVV